jgi:RNA polymerase sigma factor FliA
VATAEGELPENEFAEELLWAQVKDADSNLAREKLATYYLPFARIMAGKLYAQRTHSEFEFDEYLQLASIGLLEAIDRYNPDLGASFKTFASHRISGAILNGVETLSEKQQQISLKKRLHKERLSSLKENKKDKAGADDIFSRLADLATGLAIGFMLEDIGMYQNEDASYSDNTYSRLEYKQLQQQFKNLVDCLPERERKVVQYHYFQNFPFEEIAQILGLSKGRISQIHSGALLLLEKHYKDSDQVDLKA